MPLVAPSNGAAPAAAAAPGGVACRAAVIVGPRRAETRTFTLRDPDPGEVRVRLEGSGVCASSIPLWQGRDWFSYPLAPGAPGHEGWGVVDAIGDGVAEVSTGDRVTLLSQHAFATFDFAPAGQLVRLPDALAERAVPGEALGCAFNVFGRSDVAAGQTVAVVGIGFLGAILTRLAANAGARVIAVSRRPFALQVARAFGAAETVLMDDHERVLERVRALTDGQGCSRVIEAVGLQWPLDVAGEITAERGRLVIAGYHQDGLRQVNMQLWNWRGLDVVNAHERAPDAYVSGMRQAVAAVAAGRLDPDPLYTHRFPVTALSDALDLAVRRPDGFVKALVCH